MLEQALREEFGLKEAEIIPDYPRPEASAAPKKSGDKPAASTGNVLMGKAIKGEPIPDVRTMRPEVSASVAQLINLMCEMDVARRIADPEAIVRMTQKIDNAADYESARPGEDGIERKSPGQVGVRRWRWRFPAPRWGLAAAGAAAAVALAFVLGRTFSGRNQAVEEEKPPVVAEAKPPAVAEEKPSVVAAAKPIEDLDTDVVGPTVVADESFGFEELAAPKQVQYPTVTRAIIACDVTPRANWAPYSYFARSSSEGGIFGRDAVAVPQLFPFTDADLEKVNVAIIASESSKYPYAAKEISALRRFAEKGGLLIVLVNGPLSERSFYQGCGILKRWGLGTTEIADRSRDRFRMADDALGRGPILGTGGVYFTPSGQWRTHAALDADATKAGVCSLRTGKGMVVAVAGSSLFLPNYGGKIG